MNRQPMFICIIGFVLLTLSQRCPMVLGFVNILPRCSVITCAASFSALSEVLSREIFKDKQSWIMARALYEEKERVVEKIERVAEEKQQVVEKLERVVEEKQRAVESCEEQKNELKALYVALIAEKDRVIADRDAQLLASKSKLTVRGVLEYFAEYLKVELIKANFAKRSELRTVSNSLGKAGQMAYSKDCSATEYPNIVLLRDSYEKCVAKSTLWTAENCEVFLLELYGELSKGIHGAAWAGPKVLNTIKDMGDGGYSCFMGELCSQKFCLQLVDDTTKQEEAVKEGTVGLTLPENVREDE